MRLGMLSAIGTGAVMTLGGCAPAPVDSPSGDLAEIRYSVGPYYGTCPVYQVEVDADGTTRFNGERFTQLEGARTQANGAGDFVALRDRLAPWQPDMGSHVETPDCGPQVTDLPHYTVTWVSHNGEQATLEHDSGCRSQDARQLTEALHQAPELLGLQEWIGGQ